MILQATLQSLEFIKKQKEKNQVEKIFKEDRKFFIKIENAKIQISKKLYDYLIKNKII